MNAYVTITKVVSDEAKSMSSWIEWIVFVDLPIYATENDFFRKNFELEPTRKMRKRLINFFFSRRNSQ